MPLPNLSAHPEAVDMAAIGAAGAKQREIRSNSRDHLLDGAVQGAVGIAVGAGGTITPSLNERLKNGFIRFTGSPASDPVLEIPETARQLEFENASTRAITTTASTGELLLEDGVDSLLLEDGSGVLLLESPSSLIPIGETRIFLKDGSVYRTVGLVALQEGALLHSGQVNPTAAINFADFEIARAKFKDYAFTTTSPSSSGGTLTLDMENGNYFDVTLAEDVTTLNLNNPPATGIAGTLVFIATQDAGAGHTITFPASVIWERDTGESPAQTTTTLAVDIYMLLTVDAGTTWYGFVLGLDMK